MNTLRTGQSTRMKSTFVRIVLSTATLTLAACGVSDTFPIETVGPSTAGILRISTSGVGIKEIQQSADALATIMSKSKIPQVVQASGLLQLQAAGLDANPSLKKLDETMASLRQIGAKAVYIVADKIAAESMTDALTDELPIGADGVIFLVQTDSVFSTSDIESVAAKAFNASVIVESIGKGWYWLKSDANESLPTITDAAIDVEFNHSLNALSGSAITFGMRMTAEMRATIDESMAEEAGPLAAFTAGFTEPLKSLNSLSASIDFGPNPTLRVAMTFATKESAGEFNDVWSTTTRSIGTMAGMMMAGGGEDGEGGIDPKAFGQIAEALDMKQAESQLTLTLDDAGWKKLIP